MLATLFYFGRKKAIISYKRGIIIPLAKTELNYNVYSGIPHNAINIPIDELYFKNDDNNTRFPFRYRKLVHNKKRSS